MIKKINQKSILFAVILMIISFIPSFVTNVNAASATSHTMTLNSKGRFVRTQDAYLPERTVVELNLKNPADIFIDIEYIYNENEEIIGHHDYMYIADTGNKRIVKYDTQLDEVVMEISIPEFKTPKGVYVSKDNEIYVADKGAQAIFKLDNEGNLKNTFGKPTAPTFEDSDFEPSKLGVDNRGNMFVYAEATNHGIIHLSNSGEFLGYFTSNRYDLTLRQRIEDLIFSEEQKAKLFPRTPITFSSVFVDQNSIVYTTTSGDTLFDLKKHNIAGGNNFAGGVVSQDNTMDVYVDSQGIIYTAMEDGVIFVYSAQGEYIYSFGAKNQNYDDIAGLFDSVSALAVDGYGNIWVLDTAKSFLQSFKRTEYAEKIYLALNQYTNRDYQGAINTWQEVLRLNQMSVLAHNNIGKNYLALQKYELAMEHFEIAGNRVDYSQAFWEVRNIQLQENLSTVITVIIALVVLSYILKFIDRRKPFIGQIKGQIRKVRNIKIIDDLLYMFRVMKHPLDSYYELKKGKKGSMVSAIIIYIVFFIIFMWFTIGKDFIYQFVAVEDLDMNAIVIGFFALTLLFVVCNYLVTSINDGEGGFKQIFIMFVYSLAPLMIAFVAVTLLSYILTYNELFFISISLLIAYLWTGLNILLGVQETHNYRTLRAIVSILLTIAFMLIFVVMLTIIVVMWEQLINFFEEIIKEAYRNVTE